MHATDMLSAEYVSTAMIADVQPNQQQLRHRKKTITSNTNTTETKNRQQQQQQQQPHQRFQEKRREITVTNNLDISCSTPRQIKQHSAAMFYFVVFGFPLVSIVGITWFVPEYHAYTIAWAVFLYFVSGFGITIGYHRLWSHRAFECGLVLQTIIMIAATGAFQGSIKWWTLLHRAHHRYTDTELDPYNAKKGFFSSHVGWLLNDVAYFPNIEMHDLKVNPVVDFQNRHYDWLSVLITFVLPSMIAHLCWGDFWGGLFIAGFASTCVTHHCTWFVNSLAHYLGEQTFDDTITAKDHFLTSLVSLGEGYHNFHHEFPNDYRNGVHAWDYDPTKWIIYALSLVGLTWKLKLFPRNEINRGKWEMRYKRVLAERQEIDFGDKERDVESLPVWSEADLVRKLEMSKNRNGGGRRMLVVFDGLVYDVTAWVPSHPGGRRYILDRIGTDVTRDMNGVVYNHTNAARNLLAHMRVARYDRRNKKDAENKDTPAVTHNNEDQDDNQDDNHRVHEEKEK